MDIRKTQALSDILKDKSLLKDKCYIDGKWMSASKSIDVTNPVNESVIGSVPNMGKAETKQAIEAAEQAQKAWAKKTAKDRAAILRKTAAALEGVLPEFAACVVNEAHKTWDDAVAEVREAVDFLRYYAVQAERIMAETQLTGPTGESNVLRLKMCGEWPDEGAGSIYRLLAQAIGRCFAAARPLNNDDVSFWSLQPEQPESDLSLVRFFVAIETHCAPRQRAPLANALLRAMPRIPSRRIVRQVARLSRIVGPHPSSAIVTRWMQLRGR